MPLSIRGPHGYMVEFNADSDGGYKEWDTYTCQHCGSLKKIESKHQHMTWCKRCMGAVCENCAPMGACGYGRFGGDNPNREQWLEREEARAVEHEKEILRKLERQAAIRSYGV